MSDAHEKTGYEKKDIHLPTLVIITLLSIYFLVTAGVFLEQWFTLYSEDLYEQRVLAPQSEQLQELKAKEAKTLSTYGVVDADKGIYRIPIERAIQLMVSNPTRCDMDAKKEV